MNPMMQKAARNEIYTADEVLRIQVPARPPIDAIIRAYARLTGIRIEDLAGPSKAATISHHRHRLMYLIRRIDPVASYSLIGRHLGGRDMATIHEAVTKIAGAVETSPVIARELAAVEADLRGAIAEEPASVLACKPWQLLAAAQVLRDEQMTDAEARKVALSFIEQLEASHA